jgi:type IV pilus assembly protein PilE
MKTSSNGAQATGGFTLIELLVAVGVVAILAGVAVPIYTSQIQKAHRTDAKNALLDLAAREERYFTTNNSYTNVAANLGYPAFPVALPAGSTPAYSLSIAAATGTTYAAQAARINNQATDACGDYTINNLGTQGNVNGTLASNTCW